MKYGISIEVPDEEGLGRTMAALKKMPGVDIMGFDAIGKAKQPRRSKAEKQKLVTEYLNSLPKGSAFVHDDIANLVGKTCATPLIRWATKEKRIKTVGKGRYEKVK